jgi:hypothetical protein
MSPFIAEIGVDEDDIWRAKNDSDLRLKPE